MIVHLNQLISLCICLLLTLVLAVSGNGLCPDKPGSTDSCVTVNTWNELKSSITELPIGGELVFCPFDITKTDVDPIWLLHGVTIKCRKAGDDDECTVRGEGIHLVSSSETEVIVQGFSFKDSNDHAVHIQASVPANVHTFCDCSFVRNKRLDPTRGGSFKTEKSTGTINIVSCTFIDNFSSMGGAVYARADHTNIVDSVFINNTSSGPGGAIVAANYADLKIESSYFQGNFGEDSYAIVVKPVDGPMVFFDGGNNLSVENGNCNGFFEWHDDTCIEFTAPPASPAPTLTQRPSMLPSVSPSVAPTESPTTSSPTTTNPPSAKPSVYPSWSPTTGPTDFPSQAPTISQSPTVIPSSFPSSIPTASPNPSAAPSVSMAPTTVVGGLCGDPQMYNGKSCVQMDSWNNFVGLLETAQDNNVDELVFCSFSLVNITGLPAIIYKDINLLCPSNSCVVDGPGAHLSIQGNTNVLFSGFTFQGSKELIVYVETTSRTATTTFCSCSFRNNKRIGNEGGGALMANRDSGEVNVVECLFEDNAAYRGGAIFSRAFRLNVVSSTFQRNTAEAYGGSIVVAWYAHVLIRGSTFRQNEAKEENRSVVVRPRTDTGVQGTWTDGGDNLSVNDGFCAGFFVRALVQCQEFSSQPAVSSLAYPYVPGELSVYDETTGLRLASGLSVRQIATSGEPVVFGSSLASQPLSSIPFHVEPDGAAVVATDDGGWIYVSNCESSLGNHKGGVYALVFDSDGDIRDYHPLLLNTTRNCNGGLTPWNTWISCEETAGGHCWQVDPLGLKAPQRTAIVEPEGGGFEAFAYDIRNSSRPCFFVTEDHPRGALRRWCPDAAYLNETWNMLHGTGTRDYLKFIPGTNKFEWTPSLEEGRISAETYFPFSEGISHKNGILYFVIKKLKKLFICNLDTGEYRVEATNDQGLLIGEGSFSEQPDYVLRGPGSDLLYLTEDGGRPGVYVRKTSTGQYYSIMEAEHERYKNKEATGLAWSPDWKSLYVVIQEDGYLFEIRRDDGLPFEHDDQQLHLKYHSQEN